MAATKVESPRSDALRRIQQDRQRPCRAAEAITLRRMAQSLSGQSPAGSIRALLDAMKQLWRKGFVTFVANHMYLTGYAAGQNQNARPAAERHCRQVAAVCKYKFLKNLNFKKFISVTAYVGGDGPWSAA